MIERLVRALQAAGEEPGWQDVADILWLARHTAKCSVEGAERLPDDEPPIEPVGASRAASEETEAPTAANIGSRAPELRRGRAAGSAGRPLEVRPPAATVLPGRLEIGRALRRLKQPRPSPTAFTFDTDATIYHFCETRILVPLMAAERARWFDEVAIVVDGGPTMVVWRETVDALVELLAHHGAFSRVTRWTLTGDVDEITIASSAGLAHDPAALVDVNARRLTLVITDCIGPLWRGAAAWAALSEWGRFTPVAIVQTLPPRLWPATALGGAPAELSARRRGEPSGSLDVRLPWWWMTDGPAPAAVPVITLDERHLDPWTRMVMGGTGPPVAGAVAHDGDRIALAPPELEPNEFVEAFMGTVSEEAAQLATLLSAVDVTLPVARLILAELIPDGRQVHLAEVLASGLLELPAGEDPATGTFKFRPGIRSALQDSLSRPATLDVWRTIAPYLEKKTEREAPFSTLLGAKGSIEQEAGESATASIAAALIERLGLASVATAEPDGARPDEVERLGLATSVDDLDPRLGGTDWRYDEPARARAVSNLQQLRYALTEGAGPPPRRLDSLLIGTWNLREFDSATWGARLPESYAYIAEIIDRFDLVAVQEVRADLRALEQLMQRLGPNWSYLVSDVVRGTAVHGELLAFLYDTSKVQFLGRAGELVLPPLERNGLRVPVQQIARMPLMAAFQTGRTKFVVATVHILFGPDTTEPLARVEEMRQVARFLKERVDDPDEPTRNFIVLGDFNIFSESEATMRALTVDGGFSIPEGVTRIPGTNVPRDKKYDQIAFRSAGGFFQATGAAGAFDFYNHVFTGDDADTYRQYIDAYISARAAAGHKSPKPPTSASGALTQFKMWRTYQMSDHLPLWAEFRVDFTETSESEAVNVKMIDLICGLGEDDDLRLRYARNPRKVLEERGLRVPVELGEGSITLRSKEQFRAACAQLRSRVDGDELPGGADSWPVILGGADPG